MLISFLSKWVGEPEILQFVGYNCQLMGFFEI